MSCWTPQLALCRWELRGVCRAGDAAPLGLATKLSRWRGERRREARGDERRKERGEERGQERRRLLLSCHVLSYHVMSCHVMSRHVMSRHVTSRHVMLCHVTSFLSCHSCRVGSGSVVSPSVASLRVYGCVFSCPVCFVFSCPVRSCRVVFVSCRVVSRRLFSCHVWFVFSHPCLLFSCRLFSSLVASCYALSSHTISCHSGGMIGERR